MCYLPPRLQLSQQPSLPHAHPHSGQAVRLPLLQPSLQPVIHAEEPRPAAHRRAPLQVPRLPVRVLAAGWFAGAPEERQAPPHGGQRRPRRRCTGGWRRRWGALDALAASSSPSPADRRASPSVAGSPHTHHGAVMGRQREETS